MKNKKLPQYFYNPITLIGVSIASVSFGLILFLMMLDMLAKESKPYVGIIAFIILPVFLIMGLIIIAVGAFKERKRIKSGKFEERRLPVLDLNDTQKRRAVIIFSVGTIVLLMFSAFGSFKAYEYTETDEFCGTVCHTPMEPEFVAYQSSPHSRVGCVNCHIGSGADWFVKSKITGAYQFYSVLFNKYSRPIPTPIENLRPASGTCEQCHWPQNFFSAKKVEYNYFLSDENNTRSELTMLLKVGGGNSEFGNTSGIHWHMDIRNEIYYLALDRERNIIPYVKVRSLEDGKETIFRNRTIPFDEKDLDKHELRKSDCIDCHNRPAHIFNQPDKMVNEFMAEGVIDVNLPFIKSIAVGALEKPYSNKKIANDSIRILITEFYQNNYPEIYSTKKAEIEKAISYIQRIYDRNYFPSMLVSWRKYPNNIGHTYAVGCFRCHDGNMVSDEGKVVSNDCNICHTMISQTIDNVRQVSLDGLEFIHPSRKDIKQLCSDCHVKGGY